MGSVISPVWPMREGINEVIASTKMNAAPMGIICRNDRLMMAVFRTSHTAANIEEEGIVVANIIFDPVLFVKTAFSDLSNDDFTAEIVSGKQVFRLSEAVSWVVYSARVEQKNEQKTLFSLTPIKTEVQKMPMFPINRGFNSIIEAAVHGTRYIFSHDPELKHLIDHHGDLVKRCGGEREREALNLLLGYIS